jgi:hypothetical protein
MRRRHLVASLSVAVALIACAAPSIRPTTSPSAPPTPTSTISASAVLASVLDCETDPKAITGINYAFDTAIGGSTLEGAAAAWVANNRFGLPHARYERLALAEGTYVYRVDGRVKVAVTFSTRNANLLGAPEKIVPRYTMDALAFCDRTEVWAVGPPHRVWTDPNGATLNDDVGPDHCHLELARGLAIPNAAAHPFYVRDPLELLGPSHGSFAWLSQVPQDAVDSGYRSGELALWLSPAGDAAYVAGPDDVERWPSFGPQWAHGWLSAGCM